MRLFSSIYETEKERDRARERHKDRDKQRQRDQLTCGQTFGIFKDD